MSDTGLSHIDAQGRVRMVDVADKEVTTREAVAEGFIRMAPETLRLAESGQARKGDVFATAELAGVMGAKKTADLIPLCHALPLASVKVETEGVGDGIRVVATARAHARTGVEMEALTAVSVALVTLYDMLKAADKAMVIGGIRLLRKTGGRSGDFSADA